MWADGVSRLHIKRDLMRIFQLHHFWKTSLQTEPTQFVIMSSVWWAAGHQWQTNMSKHSEKQIFLFVSLAKSESLNLRFFRGSVFDLSHMKKSENPGFCKNVRFWQIMRIFQMVKWICFVTLIEFASIYMSSKCYETWNFMLFRRY